MYYILTCRQNKRRKKQHLEIPQSQYICTLTLSENNNLILNNIKIVILIDLKFIYI